MLKFARRNRWLLPLTLLITVVILQVWMPAGGSERVEGRSSRSKVDELEYEGGDYETEAPLEETVEAEHGESVTPRSRKSSRRFSIQRNLALLPLLLVGIAAAYAAAGYVVQRSRSASGGRWALFSGRDGKKSTGWFPWLSRGKRNEAEGPAESLQHLIRSGRRVLAPAVALALAVGAAHMLYNQRFVPVSGGPSFPNSTVFDGAPRSGTSAAGGWHMG